MKHWTNERTWKIQNHNIKKTWSKNEHLNNLTIEKHEKHEKAETREQLRTRKTEKYMTNWKAWKNEKDIINK